MTEAHRQRRAQPGEGSTVLCMLADLDATGARTLTLGAGEGRREVLVVREGKTGAVRAYVNACPHKGTPLETFPDRVLDREGRHLVCSTHGARFRVPDGLCVAGPCKGARLVPLAIRCDGGRILLVEPV